MLELERLSKLLLRPSGLARRPREGMANELRTKRLPKKVPSSRQSQEQEQGQGQGQADGAQPSRSPRQIRSPPAPPTHRQGQLMPLKWLEDWSRRVASDSDKGRLDGLGRVWMDYVRNAVVLGPRRAVWSAQGAAGTGNSENARSQAAKAGPPATMLLGMQFSISGSEYLFFNRSKELFLDYLRDKGCGDVLWSQRGGCEVKGLLHLVDAANAEDTMRWGDGRRPNCPVLDDIEAQIVSAVWLKLGREPTLGEVVRELPPCLPCHPDVEVYTVPEESPMLALRGQAAVRLRASAAPLRSGAVLGPYAGRAVFQKRLQAYEGAPRSYFKAGCSDLAADMADDPQVRAAEWKLVGNCYAIDLALTRSGDLWSISHASFHPSPAANEVGVFPLPPSAHTRGTKYCLSNATCLVNDPVGDPGKPSPGCPGEGGDNCNIAQVLALAVPLKWLRGRQRRLGQLPVGGKRAAGSGGSGSGGGGAGKAARRRLQGRRKRRRRGSESEESEVSESEEEEEEEDSEELEGEDGAEGTGPGALAGGWVFPFMVTTKQVAPGQDLWYAYGDQYFANVSAIRKELRKEVELAQAKQQNATLQERVEELESAEKEGEQVRKRLRRERRELSERVEALEEEVGAHARLEAKIKRLKAQVETLEEKAGAHAQLEAENNRLEAQVDALEEKAGACAWLKAENKRLKAQVEEKAGTCTGLKAENKRLKAQVEEKAGACTGLEAKIKRLKARVEQAASDKRGLKARVAGLEARTHEMTVAVAAMEREVKQLLEGKLLAERRRVALGWKVIRLQKCRNDVLAAVEVGAEQEEESCTDSE